MFLGIDGSGNSLAGRRSDVVALVRIRSDPDWIDIVSIPRDTLVQLPDCAGAHATSNTGAREKLNSAFSYGSVADIDHLGATAAGIECTKKTITHETGIPIDGTVVATFDGVERIIDSLDGADLPVDKRDRIIRDLNTEAVVETRHFTGDAIVKQIRIRKTEADGSDLSRISHQQEIIGALLDYYRTNDVLDPRSSHTSLHNFTTFITTLNRETTSTVSMSDLRDLSTRASANPVSTFTAPTQAAPDGVNVVWSEHTETFWQAYRDGTDLPPI